MIVAGVTGRAGRRTKEAIAGLLLVSVFLLGVRSGPAADQPVPGTGLLGIRGYRNDWTGRYGNAGPVTAWDLEKGINVLWRIPTAKFGNAGPLIVGDRLLFVVEPGKVVCVDKMSGKTLWTTVGANPALSRALFAAPTNAPPWSRRDLKYGEHGGGTYASPVTDGNRVWFKRAGAAECLDLSDGRVLWSTPLNFAPGDHPHCVPSPLLVGKVLVCLGGATGYWQERSTNVIAAGVLPRNPQTGRFHQWMVGLDADTGRILWDVGPLNASGYGVAGTPSPLVVDDGGHRRIFVVASEGHVIDPQNGKLLIPSVGRSGSTAPVPMGNKMLFPDAMIEFGMSDGELKVVKTVGAHGGGVCCNGRVYDGYRAADGGTRLMSVFDLTSGRGLHAGIRIGPVGGLRVEAAQYGGDYDYPTAAVAGRFVFFSTSHTVAVADISGDHPWPMALNNVERMHIAPVFDGNRMYLRTYDAMLCIARKGEDGARYEREVNARTVLSAFPENTAKQPVLEPKPVKEVTEWLGGPVFLYADGKMPAEWLFAGPFPVVNKEDALKTMGGCAKARPVVGQKLEHKGATHAFQSVHPRFILPTGIDTDGLTGKNRDGQSFLFTWLIAGKPEFTTLDAVKPGVRVWVGGREGGRRDVLKLAMGAYPMMIRIGPPEEDAGADLPVNVTFHRVADPAAIRNLDKALVREGRDYLKMVINVLPGSAEAKHAKSLLRAFD